MKNMKRNDSRNSFSVGITVRIAALLLILLLLFLSASVLSSCRDETTPSDDTSVGATVPLDTLPEDEPAKKIAFVSDGKTGYKFVRAASSESVKLLNACDALCDAVNKYMIDGGENFIYALRDTEEASECEILLGATNRPETELVRSELSDGDFAVKTVGKKLVVVGKTDEESVEAVEWFTDNFITESDSLIIPENFFYLRSLAPTLSSMSQEDYYWNLSTDAPEISFEASCPDGSRVDVVSCIVDGHDASSMITASGSSFVLSGVSFENGMHTAKLMLRSESGYTGFEIFHFGSGKCDDMQLYKGEVHAHTSDSDGTGTPEEAYTFARDVSKLDFFAVTDHSDSYPAESFLTNHVKIANSFNEPGKFVALYGYEQTYNNATGYFGHFNTINSTTYSVRALDMDKYYQRMAATDDAIVQFNHPGYSWGNFLEYGLYSEEYDRVVNLYEFKGSGYDNEWALCLAKGWHVSPMHNEDNHAGNWGSVNPAVGYVLAPSLTRRNITEAMNMKRSYTTTDQSMKIFFSINGEWLGGTLDAPESLDVHISINTETRGGLGRVMLVAEDNVVVAMQNFTNKRSAEWDLTLSPDYDYYYVKVDGPSGFAVTAPVWIEGRDKLNIDKIDRALVAYDNKSTRDHRVSVAFTNDSAEAMTDVKVEFYQTALGGFTLGTDKPSKTVNIGTLAAGTSAEAFFDAAYSVSTPRITAIVTGKIGDKTYADTKYLQLTNLLFTEICPSTSGYSYLEIYNATADAINLSNYKVRLWPKTGAKSDALAEKTVVLSGTIKPHSVMVVWLKTKSSATLAQFNKTYGANLTEGKDVITVTSTWDAPTARGTQIELLSGSTVISRAQYNFGSDKTDVSVGKSVIFTYQTDYTLTAVKAGKRVAATPGTFDAKLMPPLIAAD